MMIKTKQRFAIEIVLFMLCFVVVWSVRATVLYCMDDAIASDVLRVGYSSLVKFLLWIVPAFGFVWWVRHAPPMCYLGLSVLPSARQWRTCLGVTALFLAFVVGVSIFIDGKTLSFSGIRPGITLVLFYLFSPWMEEVLFRGLFLNEMSLLLPNVRANLLVSGVFAGIHLPFWLTHDGFTVAVAANTASVFIFSMVAGWLYQRSGSVWPSVLAHSANNVIAALLR